MTTPAPLPDTPSSWEHLRVSKADGSQSLDLQRDALCGAGVDAASSILDPTLHGAQDGRIVEPLGTEEGHMSPIKCGGIEHKGALVDSGTIEPETISGIEEAYRLLDRSQEE